MYGGCEGGEVRENGQGKGFQNVQDHVQGTVANDNILRTLDNAWQDGDG